MLGVVAASREGLVLGSAGMPREQATLIAALGAPLASVAESVMDRLGGSRPELLSIDSADGMIHVRGTRDIALIALTDRCERGPLLPLFEQAIDDLAALFSLV